MPRNYSSTAGEMILQLAASATDTTIVVNTTAGLPTAYPYTLILDYGQTGEEIVDVTAAAGGTLTVSRAQDGTIAQAHAFGSPVRHGLTARDLRESRQHEDSTSAHGVATVVGTTETQTLDNKTFQPAGNNVAVRLRTKAANTLGALEARDEANTIVARWLETGLEFLSGSTVLARLRQGGSATTSKTILDLSVANDINAVSGSVSGTPTGRFVRLMSGATELFYVAATGAIKAAGAVFTAAVSITGNLTATGSVTGATLASTGNTTVGGNLAVTGSTTGPLATTVSGHTDWLGGLEARVDAVEGNLGTQTTFVAASPTKDNKRIHWGVSGFTTDASGYATINHVAGFDPSSVVGTIGDPYRIGIDYITATNFRLQVVKTDGTAYPGYSGTLNYFCGE